MKGVVSGKKTEIFNVKKICSAASVLHRISEFSEFSEFSAAAKSQVLKLRMSAWLANIDYEAGFFMQGWLKPLTSYLHQFNARLLLKYQKSITTRSPFCAKLKP
jgi:hypothetical protein